MGLFLSLLRGGTGGNSASATKMPKDTESSARFSRQFNEFIFNLGDTRNAQFIEENFPDGNRLLKVGQILLQRISGYQESTKEIRAAITDPTPENEETAWRKVGPSVELLVECYQHAQTVEQVIPDVLDELCNHVDHEDSAVTDRSRGLARLLADLMQNAFAFDALKASIPAIQNDFSYYRRTLSRISASQNDDIAKYAISQDISNKMSLFYAYHNPMVKVVVDSASQYARESNNEQLVLDCLSALASGSYNTVKQSKADSAKSERLCVLVLVTCCVLYDWISASGVGSPQSTINAKAVLDLISQRSLVDSTPADKVLRANCKTIR
ncbi:hypothetical protein H4217_005864 [Coemansia sp. RSA 1939]|nr:hypothetical protein H4217_005864 [Coemansia sp. RSA 1939]KAJ2607045.1 hypothetical protein EV177_005748 [Coemansia sp. RSA 1804]